MVSKRCTSGAAVAPNATSGCGACGVTREALQAQIVTDERGVAVLKNLLLPGRDSPKASLFDESRLHEIQGRFSSLKVKHSQALDRMNAFVTSAETPEAVNLDNAARLLTEFKNSTASILNVMEKKKRRLDNIKGMILSKDAKPRQADALASPARDVALTSVEQLPLTTDPAVKTEGTAAVPGDDSESRGEEDDCRMYLVDKEYKDEMQEMRKSFIVPGRPTDDDNVTLKSVLIDKEMEQVALQTLPQNNIVVLQHPVITRLLRENNAYQQHPVVDVEPSRRQLPAMRDPKKKVNVWSILKENIGKDLSKMSMPVYAKEPITLLEKMAEFLEYRHLLRKANREPDALLRLANIAAFFVLWISQNKLRLAASFNSLLCETYEWVEGDMRFLFELVNNHPPIVACWGECDDFMIEYDTSLKTNLSLSGMEIETLGKFVITLKGTGEVITCQRPKITIHNFIFGDLHMWLKHDLIVTNNKTGDKATVKFLPKGWSSKLERDIAGTIINGSGKTEYNISGKWDSHLSIARPGCNAVEVARKLPDPEKLEFQYHFNQFAINANYKTVDALAKYAPTESRLRPDVHAYEHGDIDTASFEKNRLEEAQRARRKKKVYQSPIWFEFKQEGDKKFTTRYKGGYFEARAAGRWPEGLPDLYNDAN